MSLVDYVFVIAARSLVIIGRLCSVIVALSFDIIGRLCSVIVAIPLDVIGRLCSVIVGLSGHRLYYFRCARK